MAVCENQSKPVQVRRCWDEILACRIAEMAHSLDIRPESPFPQDGCLRILDFRFHQALLLPPLKIQKNNWLPGFRLFLLFLLAGYA